MNAPAQAHVFPLAAGVVYVNVANFCTSHVPKTIPKANVVSALGEKVCLNALPDLYMYFGKQYAVKYFVVVKVFAVERYPCPYAVAEPKGIVGLTLFFQKIEPAKLSPDTVGKVYPFLFFMNPVLVGI